MVVKRQASVKSIKRRSRKSQKITMGRSKEFLYRGLSLEELKKMSDQELFKILPSRARRSLTREMNPEQKKLYLKMNSEEKEIKTHVRDRKSVV